MKIGYRRTAGKVAWFEKRDGIFAGLLNRGHEIVLLSDMPEDHRPERYEVSSDYDVLMLEYGSENMVFYGKDWEQNRQIVAQHKGPIIYVNDDPDMVLHSKLFPDEDWSRWTFAVNCVYPKLFHRQSGIPRQARVCDFPIATLMKQREFSPGTIDKALYHGQPKGREDILLSFIATHRLAIAAVSSRAGKTQWRDMGVETLPPPEPGKRAEMFREYRASLAVYDKKHAKLGFRTGRAFHAVVGGAPAITPIGHPGLSWAHQLHKPFDLVDFVDASESDRRSELERQRSLAFPPVDWEGMGL